MSFPSTLIDMYMFASLLQSPHLGGGIMVCGILVRLSGQHVSQFHCQQLHSSYVLLCPVLQQCTRLFLSKCSLIKCGSNTTLHLVHIMPLTIVVAILWTVSCSQHQHMSVSNSSNSSPQLMQLLPPSYSCST